MKLKFFMHSICMILLILTSLGCSDPTPEAGSSIPAGALGPLETISFQINDIPVEIEIAIKPEELQQGLMYRESMPENHGMLFVYPQPRYMSFWMKNTKIPLDIAFLKENGRIINIEQMAPHTGPFEPQDRYISREKAKYALEMNLGWFEKNGLNSGNMIDLPVDQIQLLIENKQQN